MNKKQFYLIPSSLGTDSADKEVPLFNKSVLEEIELIWVENPKPARQFIQSNKLSRTIQSFDIRDIPKNEFKLIDLNEISKSFSEFNKIGFMSDAGLPCIADPGAVLVNMAREKNFEIIPLVGASSIMLGLMASGLNGQQFVFHGYLPIHIKELKRAIKGMEAEILKSGYTQIFIETPYRNNKLFTNLIENINPQVKLSIACNLLQNNQFIDTKTISEWNETNFLLEKMPTVFILGR